MAKGQYNRVSKRQTTTEVFSIDISRLNRSIFKKNGRYAYHMLDTGDFISYCVFNGELHTREYQQNIKLDTTNCHFGGYRYWFECPKCEKRVGILYLKNAEFHCRRCHQLAYVCQRENTVDRLLFKLWKIRKKLGYSGRVDTPITQKPKGMHWKTFAKLLKKEMAISRQYATAIVNYLGIRHLH